MISVALIGPDGAGKTTVGRELEQSFPHPIKYLYMGVSRDSSNTMLPTTRLLRLVKRLCGAPPDIQGPPDPERIFAQPKGRIRRGLKSIKGMVSLCNKASEEWYRQILAWYHLACGRIVMFDRHYYSDYYVYDIAPTDRPRPLARRLHGWMLARLYPQPDLVIYLDAPGRVLFERKGEGSVEALERRRHDYLAMQDLLRNFVVVDATRPASEVGGDVARAIDEFLQSRDSTKREQPDDQSLISS